MVPKGQREDISPEFDESIVQEYLNNAKENLLTLEEGFLELESSPENPDPELVDQIFRAAHSVKGGAGFLGLKNINELSHTMENLLSRVRDGEIVPTTEHIDALLAGTDLLRSMIEDVENSNEVDISRVHERLDALVRGEPVAETQAGEKAETEVEAEQEAEAAKSPVAHVDLSAYGFALSPQELEKLFETHDHLYVLVYHLDEMAQKPGMTPISVVQDLGESGKVIETRIDAEPGEALGGPSLLVLYGTVLDPDFLDEVSGLPRDRIIPVPKKPAAGILDEIVTAQTEGRKPEAEEAAQEVMVKEEPVPQAEPKQPKVRAAPKPGAAPPAPARGMARRSASIRISLDVLDRLMSLAGELVLVRNQQLMSQQKMDPVIRGTVQRLDVVTTDLQESIMRTRMQPIEVIFNKIPRIVRDLSKKLGKLIEVDISGSEVELDKTILEALADPLTHLIRNSCDHGIETPEERRAAGKSETGHISVKAFHEGGQINIQIKDDGRGIDPEKVRKKALERGVKTEAELEQMSDKEVLALILLPGFSTSKQVSAISGRGVGMDVVRNTLERLGGALELDSFVGQETTMELSLPMTLAIIPGLVVAVGGHNYIIPQINVQEVICLYDDDVREKIEQAGDQEVYRLRDHLLPLVRLDEILARPRPLTRDDRDAIARKYKRKQENMYAQGLEKMAEKDEDEPVVEQTMFFVVLKTRGSKFGLVVDQVAGVEEIVVKPMHASLKMLRCYSGATVLGDGKVALILDAEGLSRHAGIVRHAEVEEQERFKARPTVSETQHVLLFKVGEREQFAVFLPLIRRVVPYGSDQVERVADKRFLTVDGVTYQLLCLDRFLSVSECKCGEQDQMFLLIPKYIDLPFGIVMSSIEGVVEAPAQIDENTYMEDGLLGTAICHGRLTLFLDIYRLIDRAEPDWHAERLKKAPPPSEKKRILVVEDMPYFRQMLKKYLQSDYYEVITAENGRDALARIEENNFDLIVSDIQMPVMDGWEFMRNVRRRENLKNIPAVALTSLDSEKDREKAMKVGFDHYEVKMDRENFLETVARILEKTGPQGGA